MHTSIHDIHIVTCMDISPHRLSNILIYKAESNHTRSVGAPSPRLLFKVLKAKVSSENGKSGYVIDDNLTVGCKTGAIQILELQRQGKKKQNTKEFLLGKKITKRALQSLTDIVNKAYGFEVRNVLLEKHCGTYQIRYYAKSYQEYNTIDLCTLDDWEGAIEPFNMAWFDEQHTRQMDYTRERIEKLENSEGQQELVDLVCKKARALNEALAEFREFNDNELMSPWRYHATECVNLDSLTKNYNFDLV